MSKTYIPSPFPWTSKSKIGDLEYCPYNFYQEKVLKNYRKERQDSIEGTNMHSVFHNFFETVDKKHVFSDEKFTDPRIPLERHPFRKFIYEACMKSVMPQERNYPKYKNILNNFSSIECERWLRINSYLEDKEEIFNVFKPYRVEVGLRYDDLHLYGRIDRINFEIMPDGRKKLAIYDYKTGKVPTLVQNHVENENPFSWRLPSHYMKEIHFYALLYLLLTGWKLSDKVKEFLEDKKWWKVKMNGFDAIETKKYKKDHLVSLKKDYKLFKPGKQFSGKEIILGYYFLNGKKPYRPIKNYSYRTHTSLLVSINNYRSVKYERAYTKHPRDCFNYIGCPKKNCSRLEECRKLMV